MKKKLITSALCLVLLVFMLLSSTLAWFTDTEGNVNTMTVGKIDITQSADFGNLQLMPTQKVNTEVTVKNTGDQPCYVRTIFAFEDTDDGSVLSFLERKTPSGVTITITDQKFTVTKAGATTTFTVGYYLHPTALNPNTSYDCLEAVALQGAAKNDWQEKVGDQYEIFVLSQAVQKTGMGEVPADALNNDAVFGQITAENAAKWFKTLLESTNHYGDFTIAAVNP